MEQVPGTDRQAILSAAIGYFEAGNLLQAELACQRLLSIDEEVALYLLAQIAFRRDSFEKAADFMRRLTALQPMEAQYHNDYGVMLAADGRWSEAEAAYRMAVVLDKTNLDARFNLILSIFRQNRLEDARLEMDKAAALVGDVPQFAALDGEILAAEGKMAEAVSAFSRAIAQGLDSAEVYLNLGVALERLGESEPARDALEKATEIDPENAPSRFHLANLYRNQKDNERAESLYRRAIELRPDLAEAHNNLGLLLQERDEGARAAACFERALGADPALDAAHTNLGSSRLKQGWMEGAIESFKRALEINPNSAEAWNNLGNVYFRLHRLDEARDAYRRSLTLKPDYYEADLNLGILLLLEGRLAEGWQRYESRWRMPGVSEKRPKFEQPEWDGSPLQGRTLLVYSEQGMGDNLQFVRYMALLRQRYPDSKIYFWCLEPLSRLFHACATSWGVDALPPVVVGGLPPIDVQIALLTLPFRLGTVLETIPGNVPYISAPQDLVDKWAARLAGLPGKKVGVVWASGEIYAFHKFRTVRLKQLQSLFDVPGISWVSLQKGSGAGQIAEEGMGDRILDLMGEVEDFADTAAIIANLDLVISVDTSVPHLAGAMGVPVWLLDRFDTDWRWLLGRTDSPWYPSMRIFRQMAFGEWGPVMKEATAALETWVGSASPAVVAPAVANPVPPPDNIPLRLNLGCGNRKMDGFVNVDFVEACAPDMVVNLERTPWPWPANSVGEVLLIHVLEHLGATSDSFLAIISELWRVCRDGALIHIVVPHPRCDNFIGDPTHVRPVTPAMLDLFNQRLNREWAAIGAANTPLGQILGVDFEVDSASYDLMPRWRDLQASGKISEAELRIAIQEYNNVVEQIRISLRVHKHR